MVKLLKISIFIVGLFTILYLVLNWATTYTFEKASQGATKTLVTLDKGTFGAIPGTFRFRDILIRNPDAYQTDYAMNIGEMKIHVDPLSLYSDKIIIKEIAVTYPEITYETKLLESNISVVFENIKSYVKRYGKDVQIDTFTVKNGTVLLTMSALKGKTVSTQIADIRLTDIGKTDPTSPAEAVDIILDALNEAISDAVKNEAEKIGEDPLRILNKIFELFSR